ncbi:hypothetical protein GW17_00015385 [Ensete ventricosum]|nr:hypothetical protein GW17_00015385 [Ensete ventricosum]
MARLPNQDELRTSSGHLGAALAAVKLDDELGRLNKKFKTVAPNQRLAPTNLCLTPSFHGSTSCFLSVVKPARRICGMTNLVAVYEQHISKYEGDIVAKCYLVKQKLLWEVLEGILKSKMEFQWSDITDLKAICSGNGLGSLDIVVKFIAPRSV